MNIFVVFCKLQGSRGSWPSFDLPSAYSKRVNAQKAIQEHQHKAKTVKYFIKKFKEVK